MTKPARPYALTKEDIDQNGPLVTTKHGNSRIIYAVWDISQGRFTSEGAFAGKPFQDAHGRWVCRATSGALVDLAVIGVVPSAEGEWSGKFTVADKNTHDFLAALQRGDIDCDIHPNRFNLVTEP